MNAENAKQLVGRSAAELIENGMRVGLGTGSTANCFIDALAKRQLDIICVPTSKASELRAREQGLKVATLDTVPELDITVDGADEIGPSLSLIKGGGGALLFEKIVAFASKTLVVIADESKLADPLGAFPLPVEVMPFGLVATQKAIMSACAGLGLRGNLTLRNGKDGKIFVTDGGHYILDAHLGKIPQPQPLAAALANIPGVVEHGLFLGMASKALIAGANGVHEIGR